ncbi:MAG: hypothetical protein RLZZ488_2840 [Pseudomonadota bacterium]|jgi:hypothetical protein
MNLSHALGLVPKFLLLSVCSLLTVSAAEAVESRPGTMVKTQDPPCDFTPNFDFMHSGSEAYSIQNIASAAWFARQVQLIDAPRQAAWDRLPEKPIRVTDFSLGKLGLHATLLEFSDRVLMLYRGTEDALDYVLNGTFFTTDGAKHNLPGWVHEGFLINFYLSWAKVKPALTQAAGSGKKIVFAGHSLGGVLSQYAAWMLENEGVSVERVYAFQSPNPGDVGFKDAFDSRFAGRSSNTIYGEDVTPHIPPILESVEAFAEALPKQLSDIARKLVGKARYGALSGRFRIAADGTQIPLPNSDIAGSEIQFWSDYLKKSGGKPFPLGLNANSPFVADHDVDKVLCSLVRGLR